MNDLTQELYWQRACERDMTYILGARCKDGIVLVGDTKITIDGGSDSSYGKKITMPVMNIVMGAAGIGGLYKDFQNRIVKEVFETQKNKEKTCAELTTISGFSILVGKVLKDMDNYYSNNRYIFQNNLSILCAMRINVLKPELYMFNTYGYPDPITQPKSIGRGAPYGKVFLKPIWKSDMNMLQTAQLGIFIIKYIQKLNLDNTVGYDNEYLPQVFLIPDVPNQQQIAKFPIEELSKTQIDTLIKKIDPEITNFEILLKNFKL